MFINDGVIDGREMTRSVGVRTLIRSRRALALSALALAVPALAAAQAVTASSLKAAFMLNFAKFTEWPGLDPDAAIVLCIAGDDVRSKVRLSSRLLGLAKVVRDTHVQ